MLIAMTFVTKDKDGKVTGWDCEGYKAFLNKAAGNGGVLNRAELMGALEELKDVKEPEQTEEVNETEETQHTEETQEEEQQEEDPKCQVIAREDINLDGKNGRVDSSKYYWDELIKMFYSDCLKENGGQHTMKEIRFQLRKVNNIPNSYPSIPRGLKMPYDLFGDGSCTRTEKKETQLRQRVTPTGNVQARKTPQGGWQYGTVCPGSDLPSWNETYYNSEAEAIAAGKKAIEEE